MFLLQLDFSFVFMDMKINLADELGIHLLLYLNQLNDNYHENSEQNEQPTSKQQNEQPHNKSPTRSIETKNRFSFQSSVFVYRCKFM
jgi:hypothetical protein